MAVAGPAEPDPVRALRAVERASGQVAEAAAALQRSAAEVAAGGRLTALPRLEDQQLVLERALLKLQRAIAAAEVSLPEEDPER